MIRLWHQAVPLSMIILKIISVVLVIIFGSLILGQFYDRTDKYNEIKTTLKRANDSRLERGFKELEIAKFNDRVQTEAARLGSNRLDTIGDIIRVWGDYYRTGLAIAKTESGLRCEARNFNTNGTVDSSVFQLNIVHSRRGDLSDCKENIKIAYQIYKAQGPSPWVVWGKEIAQRYL